MGNSTFKSILKISDDKFTKELRQNNDNTYIWVITDRSGKETLIDVEVDISKGSMDNGALIPIRTIFFEGTYRGGGPCKYCGYDIIKRTHKIRYSNGIYEPDNMIRDFDYNKYFITISEDHITKYVIRSINRYNGLNIVIHSTDYYDYEFINA